LGVKHFWDGSVILLGGLEEVEKLLLRDLLVILDEVAH
jgi:hypothetical protein